MQRILHLKFGQKYIETEQGLQPYKPEITRAVKDIAVGCQILYYLRAVQPHEKRVRFLNWIFGKLREKYGDAWPEVWEAYMDSPEAQALIAESDEGALKEFMAQVDDIVKESGFVDDG